jgi:membrane-associated protease RseP (regulator of RpoE activity)
VDIKYQRSGVNRTTVVKLNTTSEVDKTANTSNPKGYLGVVISDNSGVNIYRYTWAAPIVGLGITKQATVMTYQGLWHALKGLGGTVSGAATNNTKARQSAQTAASNQIVGPVGIVIILKDISGIGFEFVLYIIAAISLGLGLINLLPIVPLDGGRLFLTLFTRAIGKPLKPKTEELVNMLGVLLVIPLFILTVYLDLTRFR